MHLKTYSLSNFCRILFACVLSYLSLFLLSFIFIDVFGSDKLGSYISIILSVIFATYVFTKFLSLKFERKEKLIILLSLIVKVAIGLGHYLFFFQKDYFSTTSDYNNFIDYYWMHDSIRFLSNEILDKGYFNALSLEYFAINKGALIFFLYAPFYAISGDYVMNISLINVFFIQIATILLWYFIENYFSISIARRKNLFLVLLFFPYGFFSSITMRDFAGMFLLVFGSISLCFSIFNKRLVYLLIFSIFLFFCQRKSYAFIPIIIFFIYTLKETVSDLGNGKNFFRLFVNLFYLVLGGFLTFYLFSFVISNDLLVLSESFDSEYVKSSINPMFYIFLPLFLLKSFMGAFPWTQFLEFSEITVYQPAEYLTSTYIFTILIVFLRNNKITLNYKIFHPFYFSFLLLMLLGVGSGYMHLTYVSFPLFFLLPLLVTSDTVSAYFLTSVFVFISFIMLSIISYLFISGNDIWRILFS